MSTCRFAQRVALIKNDPLLNEELDPALVGLTLFYFFNDHVILQMLEYFLV